jgi:hypothetical protein
VSSNGSNTEHHECGNSDEHRECSEYNTMHRESSNDVHHRVNWGGETDTEEKQHTLPT